MIFLMMTSVFSAVALIIKDVHKTRRLCVTKLFNAQDTAAQNINELFELNSMARGLQFARSATEKAYRIAMATGIPQGIAAARIALHLTKIAQKLFRMRQKYLIESSKMAVRFSVIQVQIKLLKHVPIVQIPKIAVRKLDNSDSPEYGTENNFAKKSIGSVRWRIFAHDTVQVLTGLKEYFSWEFPPIPIGCSAGLEQRKGKWMPTLISQPRASR
jgi:hypothetical protein